MIKYKHNRDKNTVIEFWKKIGDIWNNVYYNKQKYKIMFIIANAVTYNVTNVILTIFFRRCKIEI